MHRPLLRWTVGDCSDDGLDVFGESLWRAKRLFGESFDYLICSNAHQCQGTIERLGRMYGVPVQTMSWDQYPLDPKTCPANPTHRQGSFWKLCPPRLRRDSHEIILDNDVILNELPEEFETFLRGNRPMMSSEGCLPYGKYYNHINRPYSLNSGVIGLPPGFDFEKYIIDTWKMLGSYAPLKSWDEQGLIGATLSRFPLIIIPSTTIMPLLKGGRLIESVYMFVDEDGYQSRRFKSHIYTPHNFTYREKGYHFCEVNRIPIAEYPEHRGWHDYRTGKLL